MKSLARGQLLFVYGTLRRGSSHPLAQRLADTAEHAGEARIQGELFWVQEEFPGLTLTQDENSYVRGDLYFVPDPALLDVLDNYEGESYERRRLPVESFSMGPAAAWVYIYLPPPNAEQRIANGDFLAALTERKNQQKSLAAAADVQNA
jgi:gamma-glutamylcyclotransferase (GGCT)/AIG2-like uncharacterized protein YtfP